MFLPIGQGVSIPYRYLTRHMGIFGATGTGKTTTLGAIAERAPCPVLLLDAKGDLESLADDILRPCMAVSDIGSDLLTRALDLSEAQSGALRIALAWAQDNQFQVYTLADLRALLNAVLEHDLSQDYGLVSKMSVAAIQRAILRLERATPWAFNAPLHDPRETHGRMVYACSDMTHEPGLYGAFVCSVLDSLYRQLGELGDVATPGLLVLIDESHLIFDGASNAIVRRIEQVTRLIRSKGVGLIFVTQAPSDLPHVISGQLATRIQHALRASTAHHLKALNAAAQTMPGNVTGDDILTLETGQALVSVPDMKGRPLDARRVKIQRGNVALHPTDWHQNPGYVLRSVAQGAGFAVDYAAFKKAADACNQPYEPVEPPSFKQWLKRRSGWFWFWCMVASIYTIGFLNPG